MMKWQFGEFQTMQFQLRKNGVEHILNRLTESECPLKAVYYRASGEQQMERCTSAENCAELLIFKTSMPKARRSNLTSTFKTSLPSHVPKSDHQSNQQTWLFAFGLPRQKCKFGRDERKNEWWFRAYGSRSVEETIRNPYPRSPPILEWMMAPLKPPHLVPPFLHFLMASFAIVPYFSYIAKQAPFVRESGELRVGAVTSWVVYLPGERCCVVIPLHPLFYGI